MLLLRPAARRRSRTPPRPLRRPAAGSADPAAPAKRLRRPAGSTAPDARPADVARPAGATAHARPWRRLVQQSAWQDPVIAAARAQFKQLPESCAAASFKPTGELTVLSPAQFDSHGTLRPGIWSERVTVTGCGVPRPERPDRAAGRQPADPHPDHARRHARRPGDAEERAGIRPGRRHPRLAARTAGSRSSPTPSSTATPACPTPRSGTAARPGLAGGLVAVRLRQHLRDRDDVHAQRAGHAALATNPVKRS